MYIVRVVRSTDPGKPANVQDKEGFTKHGALHFIGTLGKIGSIRKFTTSRGRMYVVTPSR